MITVIIIITCLCCWRNSALGSLIFGNSQNTIQKLEMNYKKKFTTTKSIKQHQINNFVLNEFR